MRKQLLSFVLGVIVVSGAGFTAYEYTVTKKTAEANQSQGLYLFHESRPVQEYEVLGTVGIGGMAMSTKYLPTRESLVKKAKKDYPKADGLLISENSFEADVIRFK